MRYVYALDVYVRGIYMWDKCVLGIYAICMGYICMGYICMGYICMGYICVACICGIDVCWVYMCGVFICEKNYKLEY